MNKDEMLILNQILSLVAKLIAETDVTNDIAAQKRKEFSLVKTTQLNVTNSNFPTPITIQGEFEQMEYAHSQLNKRKDGRYYYRIKLGERLYYDVYGRSIKEVKEKLSSFYKDKSIALNIIKRKKDRQRGLEKRMIKIDIITVKEYFDKWITLYKEPNCKYSTLKNLTGLFKNHIENAIGSLDIKKLTPINIQELIATISTSCQRLKSYKLLSDMLNTARITSIIKSNPMELVKRPKHISIEQQALSHQEEEEFIEIAKTSTLWAFYSLILFEGLRPGEAKALRHCDIKDSYLHISRSLDGKNSIVSTKNEKSRNVPIFKQFEELANTLRNKSTETLFSNANKHTGNDEFSEIAKKINLGKPLYSLRHTFATRCAERSITPKQTMIWCGHSSIEITLKYYVNINDDFEKANIKIKND